MALTIMRNDNKWLWKQAGYWAIDPNCCCKDCCCAILRQKTIKAIISPSYECPIDPDGADVEIPLSYNLADNCWRGTGTGPACWNPTSVTAEMVCNSLLWNKVLPPSALSCEYINYIWVRLKTATDSTNWYSKAVGEVGCIDMCLGGGLFTGLISGTPIIQVTTCCPSSPGTMGSVCILAT